MAHTAAANEPRIGWQNVARWFAALLTLTVFELRIASMILLSRVDQTLEVMWSIHAWHAFWRVFQSRVLCPYLLIDLAKITHLSLRPLYLLFVFFCILAANSLTFLFFRRVTGSARRGMEYAGAGAALFVVLLDGNWLYPWDVLGLVLFTIFAYGVFTARSWSWFLPLFFVALLNRESALFIPVWMILNAFDCRRSPEGSAWRLVDPKALAAGAILLIGGMVWTQMLRVCLFQGSMATHIGADPAHPFGNFWNPYANFVEFPSAILHTPQNWMFFAPYFLYGVLIAFVVTLFRRGASALAGKATVLVVLMVTAASLTALVTETRVWVELIPFALFLYWTWESLPDPPDRAGKDIAYE